MPGGHSGGGMQGHGMHHQNQQNAAAGGVHSAGMNQRNKSSARSGGGVGAGQYSFGVAGDRDDHFRGHSANFSGGRNNRFYEGQEDRHHEDASGIFGGCSASDGDGYFGDGSSMGGGGYGGEFLI